MAYQKDSPAARIVRAGRALFFEHGFGRVSTDMLAKEASVSKATLYKYFPSMVEVLKVVTEAEARTFEPDAPGEINSLEELREALVNYGANLMKFLNRPEILQFNQLMNEEARAHPDIAAAFFNAAHGRALRLLTALFDQGLKKGFLKSPLTADELAEQLLGMWEGIPYVKAHMGVSKRPFPRPREWAEKCVNSLLY